MADIRRKDLSPPPIETQLSLTFREWLDDVHFYVARRRRVVVERVRLTASDSTAGVFTWEGPKSGTSYTRVIVQRVLLNIETGSTGACTVNVGTAANDTTASDDLIDGASVATDNTVLDNIDDQGTNGESKQVIFDSVPWITASVATGASAGLVGTAQIEYVVL